MDRFNDLRRLREKLDFVGYEFLTWLLLFLDSENSQAEIKAVTLKIAKKNDYAVTLGHRVVTCLFTHKEQKTTVLSPLLECSHELFASLKNGHLVEALSLNIAINQRTVGLMLHAQDFGLSQVKVKNDFLNSERDEFTTSDAPYEEILLRMNTLSEVEMVVDALFSHFIEERLSAKQFSLRWQAMRRQVEVRLNSYFKKTEPNPFDLALSSI